MKSLRVHAALFAVAALWAFQTWSREVVRDEDRDRVLAWEHDTTAFVSVRYRSPESEIEVQRREDENGAFLWGLAIEDPGVPDTLRFPVGAPGHTLMGRLAALRVIRDLGVLSQDQQETFGLLGSEESIRVQFSDGPRDLLLGDSVFGGSDRYVLDPSSAAGYVIPRDIVRPLAFGEGALRERWLHHYADTDVKRVRVTAGDDVRLMDRTESGEWTAAGRGGSAPLSEGGVQAAAGGVDDVAFANFMERVEQLAIAGYRRAPAPGGVQMLLRVDYIGDQENVLGFVELWRDNTAERDPYYIRSERTRIPAEAITSLAERVEEGLTGVF